MSEKKELTDIQVFFDALAATLQTKGIKHVDAEIQTSFGERVTVRYTLVEGAPRNYN